MRSRVTGLRDNLVKQGVGVENQPRDFSALTTIIIKLTNACNLACAYCYDYETTEKAQRIEATLAIRGLEQAIDLCANKLWVIFHGGEPMLVWPLIETLVLRGKRYAAERGVQIEFTGQTNLTRLTDRIVEFFTASRRGVGGFRRRHPRGPRPLPCPSRRRRDPRAVFAGVGASSAIRA